MTSPMDDSPTVDLTPVALPDPWANYVPLPTEPPRAVEAKAVTVAVLATMLYAVGEAVQANTTVLDGQPPWARSLILAALPSLLGLAAAYRVPSNRI